MIWTKCPKRVYVTRKTLEICVSSAVIGFNDGKSGIEKVMGMIGLTIGNQQAKSYQNVELRKKRYMQMKYSSPVKCRRKALRAVRKHWSDR